MSDGLLPDAQPRMSDHLKEHQTLLSDSASSPYTPTETDEEDSSAAYNQAQPQDTKRVLESFFWMSICFSMNHGAVTTVVSFAGADFAKIGTFSNGTLYGAYCFSALLLANVIVLTLGLKRSLITGVGQYCLYLSMYLLAMIAGPDATISQCFVMLGAAVGGIAAGYLWVAQGGYFAVCSEHYARFAGKDIEETNSALSSQFATCYLMCEIGFHFVGAVIKQMGSSHGNHGAKGGEAAAVSVGSSKSHSVSAREHVYDEVMYIILFVIGLASAFGMTKIEDMTAGVDKKQVVKPPMAVEANGLEEHAEARSNGGEGEVQKNRPDAANGMACDKVSAAISLLFSDPKMALMLPTEFAFGLASAFLNAYVSPHVTTAVVSNAAIGYFTGIVAIVACLSSYLGGSFAQRTGRKAPVMVCGACAFVAMALMTLVFFPEGAPLTPHQQLANATAAGNATGTGTGTGTRAVRRLSLRSGRDSVYGSSTDGEFEALGLPEGRLLLEGDRNAASSWTLLFFIYAAQGVGRGIFESTNKAVIADFFGGSGAAPAAFANVIWSSGGSAAVGYFMFPLMHQTTQAFVTMIMAIIGAVCFLAAQRLHLRQKVGVSTKEVDEASGSDGEEEEDQSNALTAHHGARSKDL